MASPSLRRRKGALRVAIGLLLLCGAGAASAQQIDYDNLWTEGVEFEGFLESADRLRDQWIANFESGAPEQVEVARARAGDVSALRLLVVAEDWCGDSVNTLPYLARLVQQVSGLQLRVIGSGLGGAVMAAHPTPDGRKATPTVVLIDATGAEIGAWVERPSNLQGWFLANEEGLSRRRLYRRKYDWYAEDRGRSTVREIVDLLASDRPRDLQLQLQDRDSGTDALLQAISPVDDQVVWASGHQGTWARSIDGGGTWVTGVVEGADQMQFRDVHGVDAQTAFLLSAGSGDASRIYRTDDGGSSWQLQFRNEIEAGFLDCFDFWDASRGLAFSDSVDGGMYVLRTLDGRSWQRLPPGELPSALPGEGSFAASGTCVVAGSDGRAWIGTGAAESARILTTPDYGESWVSYRTPLPASNSAGIASLAFRTELAGVALGGDIAAPEQVGDTVALTSDGGVTWRLGGRQPFAGAVYGAAFMPDGNVLVAVGPGGIALSPDGGGSWRLIDPRSHWAVDFTRSARGWAVGPEGRITEIRPADR